MLLLGLSSSEHLSRSRSSPSNTSSVACIPTGVSLPGLRVVSAVKGGWRCADPTSGLTSSVEWNGDADVTDGGTGDVENRSETAKGNCLTGGSDSGGLQRSCRGSPLGIAAVARGGLKVVESLSGNGQKVSISSAIAGRAGDGKGELCATCESSTGDWFGSGGLQGSTDVKHSGDGWSDASDSCSRGNDRSPRGDSSLVATIVAWGDSSSIESLAENEPRLATSSTIDGREGDQRGATGESFNSS